MVVPLIAVGVGGLAVAGIGLAAVASIDPNETVGDKIETTLVRIGYVSEGVIKGSIISIPTSFLILLAFKAVTKMQKRVI
tara:strand:- start:1378 stop:1617 length:240 start_codon:yes stop_codon:yes gene_type:complete